jgi:hypothetical protein
MQQNRKLLLADNAEEYENDCCVGDSKPGCQITRKMQFFHLPVQSLVNVLSHTNQAIRTCLVISADMLDSLINPESTRSSLFKATKLDNPIHSSSMYLLAPRLLKILISDHKISISK